MCPCSFANSLALFTDDTRIESSSAIMATTTNTSMCDMDCSTIQTPDCQVSVCNEGRYRGTVGVCVVVPDEDGVPCEDSEFCTVDDACVEGICVGGPENDCGYPSVDFVGDIN